MSLESAQDPTVVGMNSPDNKEVENDDSSNNDNTSGSLGTDETKPSETEQSKDEESNNEFEKAEEFDQRLENTNTQLDDLIVSVTTENILSPAPTTQGIKNAPNSEEVDKIDTRNANNESPKLIDYGDYYADIPDTVK